jgi:hypothetical protein
MPIAECGLKKKTKKIRNPQSEITGPMLFPRNTLPCEPQACSSAERNRSEVKGGKGEFIIDENFKN